MRAHGIWSPSGLQRGTGSARGGVPLWQKSFVFLCGLSVQFNVLVGGSGEGSTATGGYGYRLTDVVALGAVVLLGCVGLLSVGRARLLSLALFVLVVVALFGLPILSPDPRTSILAVHYALYCLAALFVAMVLSEAAAVDAFCWGLIAGVVATIPVFAMQASGFGSALVQWGLVPGYTQAFSISGEVPRYTGLSGHPNEAGHVAALSAAAAGYLAFAHRRLWPIAVVGASLFIIFLHTWSRASLIVGGVIIFLPALFVDRRLKLGRVAFMAVTIAILVLIASQVDSIAARFAEDANQENNITERINSILFGLQLVLTNPVGISVTDLSNMLLGAAGVGSAHNGFLFFGGVFGWLPLAALVMAIVMDFRIRNDADIFFALLALQVTLSFLFEILSGSYSYVFMMCLIGTWAFLKTPVGSLLRFPLVPGPRAAASNAPRRSRPSSIGN